MEEVRKVEGLALEELEDQSVELLPDREELHHRFSRNTAIAVGINGSAAAANAGNVFVFVVD
jgi:hypothetical protein